jgi:hypothetical protein
MILPFNLRDEFLYVVQTPACFQAQFVGSGAIGPGLGRFLDGMQTGAKRLVHHQSEWRVEFLRDRSRLVEHIVVYRQCRSHGGIVASRRQMSRHHMTFHHATRIPDLMTFLIIEGWPVIDALVTIHLACAVAGDFPALRERLDAEARVEQEKDRLYWEPLKRELESFRRTERATL